MKRLLTYWRIIGTGTGRIVFLCAAALLIIYTVLILFCGWSDRCLLGVLWFYHDLRYWPKVGTSLHWIAVIAMSWRITSHGLSSVLVKNNTRHERCQRIVLNVFDGVGRMGALVAGVCFLFPAELSVSTFVAMIGKYGHWFFDPIEMFVLLRCPQKIGQG